MKELSPSGGNRPLSRPEKPARRGPSGPARWLALAAALALIFGSTAAPAGAQEEEGIEYSVMAPLAARSLLLDVTLTDGTLVAAGERGHILVSRDGGTSWNQARVPTRSMLTSVFFIDPEHGWAVGHDGVVLRTLGGPDEWERVRWAPEEENPLFDVWFSDTQHGIAVGAYGTFLVTQDGGTSWSSRPLGEDDYHLHRIVPAWGDTLFMPAEAGMIYRSDDAGLTWRQLPSPYEGSFFGAVPLDENSILLFGLRGHLYRSDDGGTTWEAVETGTTAMLTDGIVLDDGTVVITGLGGVILLSRDGGRTFELEQQPGRRGIQAVIQDGEGKLVLAGEFGVKTLSIAALPGGSR